MLVKPAKRDDQGSALVSVLVMMLVLTLFALTLAAIITNTTTGLSSGRETAQARAAADAGIVAALASFKQAEDCTGTVASTTAPIYSVTCSTDTTDPTQPRVTFTSIGASAAGAHITVQSVWTYTTSQSYDTNVGQLTFFQPVDLPAANTVASSTSDPARVTVASGNFTCRTAMAANVVVEGDFYANNGCSIAGWVKVKGDAVINAGGRVRGSVTTAGSGYVNGEVGGDLTTKSWVWVDTGGTVTGSVSSASTERAWIYGTVGADVGVNGAINTSANSAIGGNVTAAGGDYADLSGTIGGYLQTAGYAYLRYNSTIGGNLSAAGSNRTYIYGTVKGDVAAGGTVYVDYSGNVSGNLIAAGTERTDIYGKVGGFLKSAGAVTLYYNATIGKYLTTAGTNQTLIYSAVGGDVTSRGTVYVDYNGVISGSVTSASTGTSSVYGRVSGDFSVTGVVFVDYNGVVKGNLNAASTGTTNIYGTIGGNVNSGGSVTFPNGSIGGNVTLPRTSNFTPSNARQRVGGLVIQGQGPATQTAPTVTVTFETLPQVVSPASPTIPIWQDYGFAQTDWSGYDMVVLARGSSWCSNRNWASNLSEFTADTVVDATACQYGLTQHPASMVTVAIKAKVAVISTEVDLQNVTFNQASGASANLWFIVPSDRKAVKNYSGVTEGNGNIYLNSSNLNVPTMLYTPRNISYTSSTFTGSMYANDIQPYGTPGGITAAPMKFPIEIFDSTGSGTVTPGVFSMSLDSQREVR
jgi:cytoskeletal protein CcmA (bactofilin family)/Tfp pilus assembly protein PilX